MALIAIVNPLAAVPVFLILVPAGDPAAQRIGTRGQGIVARFMGLVLVAIGAQLVLGGVAEFFDLATAAASG